MASKNLNVRISQREWDILLRYCQQQERGKTDVIREFIRSLEAKLQPQNQATPTDESAEVAKG